LCVSHCQACIYPGLISSALTNRAILGTLPLQNGNTLYGVIVLQSAPHIATWEHPGCRRRWDRRPAVGECAQGVFGEYYRQNHRGFLWSRIVFCGTACVRGVHPGPGGRKASRAACGSMPGRQTAANGAPWTLPACPPIMQGCGKGSADIAGAGPTARTGLFKLFIFN